MVRRIISKGQVRAILFKTSLAIGTRSVGINQASHCSEITWLEFGDCRADVCHSANYLVAWNAGIDSRHYAPLITDLMEVRVADTTKEDFDLDVVIARIPSRDQSWNKRRG